MYPVILHKNLLALASVLSATDTDSDDIYDVLNLIDLRRYTYWKAASAGTKYITLDAGSAVSADILGIICHNLYTATATVSVEYSSDNFSADINVALAGFAPSDDKALLKTFTSQSARYWRVKIITASVVPYMAVLVLGGRITLPYPPDGPFDFYNEGAKRTSRRGGGGELLGVVTAYEDFKLALKVSMVDRSWVTGTFKPFWDEHGIKGKPFFLAPDLDTFPGAVFFGSFPDGFRFKMPLRVYPWVEHVAIEMEGVKE